jgi:hypothetical protein
VYKPRTGLECTGHIGFNTCGIQNHSATSSLRKQSMTQHLFRSAQLGLCSLAHKLVGEGTATVSGRHLFYLGGTPGALSCIVTIFIVNKLFNNFGAPQTTSPPLKPQATPAQDATYLWRPG